MIIDHIMTGKNCKFEFSEVTVSLVEKLLLGHKYQPSGVYNMDTKLLKLVANSIAIPICHVLDLSLEKMCISTSLENCKDYSIT